MRFIRFSSNFLVFAVAIVATAQIQNPGDDDLFRELEVTEIRVTMSAADKTFLLAEENRYAEIYVPADVTFTNTELNVVEVKNVGIRLRGNTARGHDKRSYKIDFREYGGEKFKDYKKINLKPDVNDPTMARELLSMHIYRKMGVPAARIAPAALYMNNEFMGTYLMVEQLDDEFIDKRYGHEEGFLYKCAYGATLQDNGQVYNGDLYESEMNDELDTRAELDLFVDKLNNTASVNFVSVIEQYFDVDMYLRQLAVEAILGHWDGYSYNKNNFYLFYNGQTNRFVFIPYDTDNTWGIDWVGQNWGTFDIEIFYHPSDPRPLTRRILEVPAYQSKYLLYVNNLLSTYFRSDYLLPLFSQLEALFDPWVAQDTYFDNAFGFSRTFFQNNYDYSTSGHVEYGLRGFLNTRYSSTDQYILSTDDAAKRLAVYPNPSTAPMCTLISSSAFSGVKVRDLSGKRVNYTLQQVAPQQWNISLANATPGMYVIQAGEQSIKWVVR